MASVEELKEKLKTKMSSGDTVAASTLQSEPVKDRFIKGTLLDDKIIGWLLTSLAYVCFIAILGGLYLWVERLVGVKQMIVWRYWVPTVYMLIFMLRSKPFKFGFFGYGMILVQSVNLAGFLFQAIQGVTGIR